LRDEQDENQLMNAVAQLQQNLTRLVTMNYQQLRTSVTKLQDDVAEVKAGSRQKYRYGKLLDP